MSAPELMRFYVPLTKSYTTTERGQKQHILEGVASDESSDEQQEVVIQEGMDFAPFLKGGFINWDHLPGPENIIGEPLHAEIRSPTGKPEFFVRALMYVDDKERAREAWNTAEAMRKAGGRRSLGWSVEGSVAQRIGSRIAKSIVRQVALTHQPVNTATWAAIAKSLAGVSTAATTQTAQPLMTENLDQRITSVLWGDCAPDRACYGPNGYFYGGRSGMLEHLCKCKGMPVTSAAALMKRLIDSGI